MFAEIDGERVSMRDLSLNGAFIAAKGDHEAGETFELKVWLGVNEMVEVEAVIRRIVEDRGIGVEFLNLDDETRGRLERFLNTNRHGAGPGA